MIICHRCINCLLKSFVKKSKCLQKAPVQLSKKNALSNLLFLTQNGFKNEGILMGCFCVLVLHICATVLCYTQNPMNGHKKTPYKSRRNSKLVEVRRVELLTFAMPLQRSTNWAIPPKVILHIIHKTKQIASVFLKKIAVL